MEVVFLRQAHRFIKKAGKPLKSKIKEVILKIKEDPFCGDLLKGKLKNIHSHHFSFKGTQYRIAYQVMNNIIVIAVSTRENFYRDL